MARDDALQTAKDHEKRAKNMESDCSQLNEDLASSERSRKAVEVERDELQDEAVGITAAKFVFILFADNHINSIHS